MLRLLFSVFATLICSVIYSQVLVSSYTWISTQPPVYTFSPEAGKCYRLDVSGIFTDTSDPNNYQDAYYSFNLNAPQTPWATNAIWWCSTVPFNSMVPNTGAYTSTHNYSFYFTFCPGQTVVPFTLSYSDSQYANNAGDLTFKWYELPLCNPVYPTVELGADPTGCGPVTLDAGSTGTETYLWSTGDTTQTIAITNSGAYSVTVSNGSCRSSDNVNAQISTISVNTMIEAQPLCSNNNGWIAVSAFGGQAPKQYSNDNGVTFQNTNEFFNLSAGTYYVVVKDANNCIGRDTVELAQTNNLTISIIIEQPAICTSSTGHIAVTVYNGSYPFEYSIDGGATFQSDENLMNLAAGTYTVLAKDANGCTVSDQIVLNAGNPTSLTSSVVQNPGCGSSTGQVQLTANDATAPFQYSKDGGITYQANNTFTGLAAGVYGFSCLDANGCISYAQLVLNDVNTLNVVSASLVQSPMCGNPSGIVTVNVTGGLSPYSYIGSSSTASQTSSVFTGLPAGSYMFTVTDANNCTGTTSIDVSEQASTLQISYVILKYPSCQAALGHIRVTGTSGAQPYVYSNDNGNTYSANYDFENLGVGVHTFIVKDNTGCTDTVSVVLNSVGDLDADIVISNSPRCGSSTGAIDVIATGSALPRFYSISGGPQNQASSHFAGLAAGTYSVTVTDANGCVFIADTLIEEAASDLNSNITITANPSCGSSTGSIIVNTTGTSPFQYSIDGGAIQASASFSNLSSGLHTVVTTASNNCRDTSQITLIDQNNLSVNLNNRSSAVCTGKSNGYISPIVTGNTDPTSYQWTGAVSANTLNLTDLLPGNYYLSITDANNCILVDTVVISVAANPSLTLTKTDITCFGNADGKSTVTATGGMLPYTYLWSHSKTTSSVTSLSAGSYYVTVTDRLGCTSGSSVLILEPAELKLSGSVAKCSGFTTVAIDVTASGGTAPLSYLWSGGSTGEDLSGGAPGSYSVTVTDANQCKKTTQFTVDSVIVSYSETGCISDGSGVITTSMTGGEEPYSYKWNTGDTTNSIKGVTSGKYSVTISDSDGCSKSLDIETDNSATCLNIPNAFTPNGDNVNDTWIIDGLSNYKEYTISVYNRFGARVFDSTNSYNPWDGKFGGVVLPTASYFYVIEIQNLDKFTGVLTIKTEK